MNIFDRIHDTPGSWLLSEGNYSDIILSSRIRLARNISKKKFPEYMDNVTGNEVKEIIKESLKKNSYFSEKKFEVYNINDLENEERLILFERHLISKNLINKNVGMLVVEQNENLSIMINEEDHFRIQSIYSGLQLTEALEKINELDDELEKNIDYAFSPEFGYLTSCPTNVGTGMRCSILVHLPGIVMTKKLNKIKAGIEKVGLTLRGYYGEGTEAIGNFFQISNQITLGKTELEISEKIENIALNIIEHEKAARTLLLQNSKIELEDQIFRAYGILQNSRILTSKEAMILLSLVRLGINLKLISDLEISRLNHLLIMCQPGHLQKFFERDLIPEKRDFYRAKFMRECL